MYTREELIKQFEEIEKHQREAVTTYPNDYKIEIRLSQVEQHLQQIRHAHNSMETPKTLVFENTDYRSMGDNHSEVFRVPIFRCCSKCAEALHWLLIQRNSGFSKQEGLYYSVSPDQGQELNEKIIIYKGRSYEESMQDDELIINPEYYD
jgi:hypothetical protein